MEDKLGLVIDWVLTRGAVFLFVYALLEGRFDAAFVAFMAIVVLTSSSEEQEGEQK